MSDDHVSPDEAREFLGWPAGYEVPDEAELVADARAIVQTNFALNREPPDPRVLVSPIWYPSNGKTIAKLALLPPEFRRRYFDGAAQTALMTQSVHLMIADFIGVFADQPEAGMAAMHDVDFTWWDEGAPIKEVAPSYKGHSRLLSLMLADVARKASAGFSSLEMCASWGGLKLVHDPAQHAPAEQIKASVREKTQRMRNEEDGWKSRMLGGPG